MKLNMKRNAAKVTLFAAALLATSLFAGSANAQSAFKGKFTLSQETRWGHAVLPAGDYVVKLDNNIPNMLVIRDAKSGRGVAYEPVSIREDSAEGGSALLIGTRGSQRVVHSFRVAELGETFVYDRELSRRAVEEANSTETVTVLEAKQ
jgi:hypothetical protein